MAKKIAHNNITITSAQKWPTGWLAYALLIIICIAAYGSTVNNSYAFDDVTVTTGNSIVSKGFAGISEIFTTL